MRYSECARFVRRVVFAGIGERFGVWRSKRVIEEQRVEELLRVGASFEMVCDKLVQSH
jgi:hypothetical protein